MRLRSGDILVIATKNQKKVNEFKLLLRPFGLKIISLLDLDLPSPDETGTNFKDNATVKVQACSEACEWAVLADDSGLCVKALGGQPGVYTDRWAGADRNYGHAMQKINDEVMAIDSHPDRRAEFICALAFRFANTGNTYHFEGRVEGELVWPARGKNNMSFDPIFAPLGQKHTYAEMTAEEKSKYSARQRATQKFIESCIER